MTSDPWPQAKNVFQGVRFDVFALDLDKRSGGTKRREVVKPADAVVILPILDDQTVVLIRNDRFAVGKTLWELPAGTIEPDEPALHCAARELTEETGYHAARLDHLFDFYTTPGFCTEQMFAYLAQELTFKGQDLDETEKIESCPIPLADVKKMMFDNRIRDGKTVATLLYYLEFSRTAG